MYYQDNHVTIYNRDCRNMSELPDESVQCVVTSPPYWGLRKYSGEQELVWGGEKDCEHEWNLEHKQTGQKHWNQGGQVIPNEDRVIHDGGITQTGFCQLCGAWKGAYGLEPDPESYVQHTIEILQEVKRVLRKDGVVFWNIGDSYYNDTRGGLRPPSKSSIVKDTRYEGTIKVAGKSKAKQQLLTTCPICLTDTYDEQCCGVDLRHGTNRDIGNTLKPKDLCLIPFRVAIAAQEAGWWVRSVIIWSKPNPMPESVGDRPTESHEYILMLTKSARYYWDADAVREAYTEPLNRWGGDTLKANGESMWDEGTGQATYRDRNMRPNPSGRNLRSVWEFPTQPYPEAHFAVFPEKLPEICIKAATPEVGCCSKCGAPWERIRKPTAEYEELLGKDWNIQEKDKAEGKIAGHHRKHNAPSVTAQYETLGWQQTCQCQDAEKAPSLVLDLFMGAGTTLFVAKKLNRRAVGYELSGEYCELALERNRQLAMEI